MLVLSRKKCEAIVIGDGIRVTVVEIRGDKVRLGIEAPKDVSVHRHEVITRIANAALSQTIVELPLDAVSLTTDAN